MKTEIYNYLDKLFGNPRCELNYRKDYELLIAVMLSAQTTDKRVNLVTAVLFEKYPTIESLSKASLEDIKAIIKPIGTFNKKALNILAITSKLIEDYNGIVPNNREYLESLDGVGRKTTNVVLSNLFNVPCIAVDTHVARVSIRLGIAKKNDTPLEIEKKLNKKIPKYRMVRLHHQLVLFGRYKCKAIKPECETCEIRKLCKYYKKTSQK